MVVENTRDLVAYEKTGKYEGVYHVLGGAISQMCIRDSSCGCHCIRPWKEARCDIDKAIAKMNISADRKSVV